MRLGSLIVVVFAMASLPARAGATQEDLTPCGRFGSDAAVFVAEIGEPTRHWMKPTPDGHPIEITALAVKVERSFRGVAANRVVYLYPVDTAAVPKAGSRHLVSGSFNFGDIKDVVMPITSKPVEEASDDLAFLESSDPSSNTGSISGVLVQGNPFDVRDRKPLPGVTIRFRSRDTTVEAVSDDRGRYAAVLPEGLVRIEPLLPDHLVGRGAAEIRAGGCTSHSVIAQLNGRIRGRVLRPDASPLTWLVTLVPVDERRDDIERGGRHVKANEKGEYEISALPPGEYLVGVNLNRPPDNGAPFPPTYYPGTVRREEAVPVVVGQGTVHDGVDFTLGDSIRPGKLEIRIEDSAGAATTVVCLADIGDSRSVTGATYPSEPGKPTMVEVLEGSRYRFFAHVERPNGHTESDTIELTGAAGHQVLTVSATLPGRRHPLGEPCVLPLNSGR